MKTDLSDICPQPKPDFRECLVNDGVFSGLKTISLASQHLVLKRKGIWLWPWNSGLSTGFCRVLNTDFFLESGINSMMENLCFKKKLEKLSLLILSGLPKQMSELKKSYILVLMWDPVVFERNNRRIFEECVDFENKAGCPKKCEQV